MQQSGGIGCRSSGQARLVRLMSVKEKKIIYRGHLMISMSLWWLDKRIRWGCGFSRRDGHATERSVYLYHRRPAGAW